MHVVVSGTGAAAKRRECEVTDVAQRLAPGRHHARRPGAEPPGAAPDANKLTAKGLQGKDTCRRSCICCPFLTNGPPRLPCMPTHGGPWWAAALWPAPRRLLSPSAVTIYIYLQYDCAQGVLRVLRACKCRRLDRVQMQLPPASPLEELSLAGAATPFHKCKR